MKLRYVKTSNHERFMAGLAAMRNRGASEACILLLMGDPGTGKSCTVDNWGSEQQAIYIEGMPGMSLPYVWDYLSDQTGIKGGSKFDRFKLMVEYFKRTRQPIILDEAQHGLPNKAECIETLRRLAEQAGSILVLVCHTSERHRFGEHRLAHIATRISSVTELKPANREDVGLYLRTLCEVGVDDDVVATAHEQSRGWFRLMANATITLERIAAKLGKTHLAAADIKGIRLCEDAMSALNKPNRRGG